jgi:peptidyl-tRNA hydrolase
MKPAMYIFLNKGLGMSTGKSAAQAAHAAVEAYRISPDNWIKESWYKGGHYMKLVMECRDSDHLRDTERYLNDRGFKTVLILDEGHTEVPPITPTALAVALVDKDDPHTAATFESFRLYKDFCRKCAAREVEDARRELHRRHLAVPRRYRRLFGIEE